MKFPCLNSAEDMAKLVDEMGFLPFFRNEIEGFSIEELTPAKYWFSDEEGAWEWKGPAIRQSHAAYGKFFKGKAMFVSRELFSDFANYRRDGYDFDSRMDEGLVRYGDDKLYLCLDGMGPCLSRTLKSYCGYGRYGLKGFDGAITRLQAQCYALISDFVYEHDKSGATYGWGVAQYATPEQFFGEDFKAKVYQKKPADSYDLLFEHLRRILPGVDEAKIKRLLG